MRFIPLYADSECSSMRGRIAKTRRHASAEQHEDIIGPSSLLDADLTVSPWNLNANC